MNETVIPQMQTVTFLGAKLDSRLTWKAELDYVRNRAVKRVGILRKLSGTTWGANARILKSVYTSNVRPVTEYASSSWTTASKSNKAKLDKIQNMGLRTILGAMKSTPIHEMQKTANI